MWSWVASSFSGCCLSFPFLSISLDSLFIPLSFFSQKRIEINWDQKFVQSLFHGYVIFEHTHFVWKNGIEKIFLPGIFSSATTVFFSGLQDSAISWSLFDDAPAYWFDGVKLGKFRRFKHINQLKTNKLRTHSLQMQILWMIERESLYFLEEILTENWTQSLHA